jgi:multiple sugar transport system substrate-binding protein/sn-glycerol 3-phosphate transport system substrate-binding protein
MRNRKLAWLLLVALLGGAIMTACSPAPTEAPAPTQAPAKPAATEAPAPTAAPTMPESPMANIDPSGQTVTFWHVWGTGGPSDGMKAVVDNFNATNEYGITVNALEQGNYSDLEDAMNAAIQSGDVPSVVVGYTNALSNWYQVNSIVDLNPYVNDPKWGLDDAAKADFYSGAFDGGTIADGSRIGYPISQSANVLFYNSGWAKELGFDSAPTTPDEFKAQACAAADANNNDATPDNDGTGGFVMYNGASNIASWIFAYGGSFLNDSGDGYNFSNDTVKAVAQFRKDLWDSGCAFATESYPNPEFASRKAMFVASSTAGIPYQESAFDADGAIKDEWSIIPFVGPNGGKAVNAFGQYVAVVNTTPEQTLASWLFLKYLTSPETQAEWIKASAYYPTRKSTVDLLGDYASQDQYWNEGLDLVQYGQSEPSLTSWTSVRREVQTTFDTITQSDPGQIPDLLSQLDDTAAQAVQETQ